MNKIRVVPALAAIFSTSVVFANDQDISLSDSKTCATIANACLNAGFVRTETADKRIWQDCMKPIILGKTVSGVTVDVDTVKTCRTTKINKMKKELKQFEKACKRKSK
jgi:hypothetical protein